MLTGHFFIKMSVPVLKVIRFTNVSQPKVALNKKYLLISTTDHIDVWDGEDDYREI